jgi:hypothetical protein
MARHKPIDSSPCILAVELKAQLFSGTFEHAQNGAARLTAAKPGSNTQVRGLASDPFPVSTKKGELANGLDSTFYDRCRGEVLSLTALDPLNDVFVLVVHAVSNLHKACLLDYSRRSVIRWYDFGQNLSCACFERFVKQ